VKNRKSRSRSGFSAILALVLMGLVSTALGVLLVSSQLDVRLTRMEANGAAVRQLMLAAVFDTTHRAEGWPDVPAPKPWTLNLPGAAGSARMETSAVSKDAFDVRVTCDLPGTHHVELLRFGRVDSRWRLIEVAAQQAAR
jgi:hypothetical protein